jgi:hypothetical protein
MLAPFSRSLCPLFSDVRKAFLWMTRGGLGKAGLGQRQPRSKAYRQRIAVHNERRVMPLRVAPGSFLYTKSWCRYLH